MMFPPPWFSQEGGGFEEGADIFKWARACPDFKGSLSQLICRFSIRGGRTSIQGKFGQV